MRIFRLFLIATLTLTLTLFTTAMKAQPSNTNCATANLIANPTEFCSGESEFTTASAGGSEFTAIDCFENVENDVWFRFVAIGTAVNIVVNGDVGGNLQDPRIIAYTGGCDNLPLTSFNCAANNSGPDVVNLLSGSLVIGSEYLIRVGGANNNEGSFQLCVNNFNPPVEPGQDAETAAVLCDKASFVIQALSGGGSDNNEAAGTCLDVGGGATENQSSWTTWIADNNGELSFTITPINTNDDIDFVLYELPNGVDDFSGKINLRCMASSCVGATGLRSSSTDFNEQAGCSPGDDNFVRSLMQEEGKAYALLINNFSNTGIGISLTFGGDAEFQGPQADFSIEVSDNILTCDKIIDVIDNSTDNAGNLIDYLWNFGEDADPQTGQGAGPFDVTYATFGPKFVALTITSDLGCRITEVREINVLPCCADAEVVNIDVLDLQNIGCGNSEFGSFSIQGSGGLAEYMYSFEGSPYGLITSFSNLDQGDYTVGLIDRRGCEISQTVSIVNIDQIIADAGMDVSIEFLGDSIQLDGSFMADNDVTVNWSPSNEITCSDGSDNCLNPFVTPLGTTTYTLIVSNTDGCVTTDEVVVEVLKIRPLFAPNMFSPNEDGVNDYFTLSGNSFSVANILEFSVYDRWGGKVYAGRNLSPNDINAGWDGNVEGVPMDQGVYIWVAKLEFVDPSIPSEILTGDVTLVR